MKLEIIDANSRDLVEYIRVQCEINHNPVFRFFSILDYGYPLNGLIPSPQVISLLKESQFGDSDTLLFDKAYANQLLFSESFIDFMKLLYRIQETDNTILITNYLNPNVTPIVDSLLKLIQQRYGLNVFIVNDIDDIDRFGISDFASWEGYSVYLEDVKRVAEMTGLDNNGNIKFIW